MISGLHHTRESKVVEDQVQGRNLQNLHDLDEDDWDRHLGDRRKTDDTLNEHNRRLSESPESSTCPFFKSSDHEFVYDQSEGEGSYDQANGEPYRRA